MGMGWRGVAMATVWGVALSAGGAGADPARPGGAFQCGPADTTGLPAADAATAVDIACRELAAVSGSSGAFAVSVRPLGGSVVLTVSRADAADGRSLVLNGLGEVPTAARRLAEAVVRERGVEATQRVDNLVESEGRELVTRQGDTQFAVGAAGLAAGQGTGTGAGFSLGLAYETPSFSIPAELRWARSGDGEREVGLFSIDTGARYYVSRRGTSPFVGGGFSVLYLSLTEQRQGSRWVHLQDSGWGPGVYAEAGVQLLRLHRARLTAKVRADFPFYSLRPEGFDFVPDPGRRGYEEVRFEGGSRYLVPVTFGVTLGF